MRRRDSQYFRALVIAIGVHLLIGAAFLVSFNWTRKPEPPAAVEIVQAKVIDEKKIIEEREKLKREEQRKKAEEEQRRKDAQEKQRQKAETEKRKIEEQKHREEEQQRLLEVQKQREEDRRQLQEKQEAEKRVLAEKKREQEKVEEQKRKQEEAERQRKVEAEKQRKAEEERRRVEEEKRKEAERQRKLEEEREALRRQLEEEERQRRAAEQAARNKNIVNQHIALITQKIERSWIKPVSAKQGMSCTLKVRLIPGGEVIAVQVMRSSGDPLFDRSAETAVRKASPLPVPSDPNLFEQFREIEFPFKPEQ